MPVGAAAGIAAAFNAPIAAVTFTIEEVIGDLDQTVLSGVIVAAAIERGILGVHPVFTVTQVYGLHHVTSVFFYAALGIAAAFVSLAFTEPLLKLRRWFGNLKVMPVWIQPAVGGAVTGALAVAAFVFVKAGGINGGGYDTVSVALSGSLAFKAMAVLCIFKLIVTVFSYSSGGAGGIFAPALFIGGMLGGIVGLLDVNLMGHANTEIGRSLLSGWAQYLPASSGHQ